VAVTASFDGSNQVHKNINLDSKLVSNK